MAKHGRWRSSLLSASLIGLWVILVARLVQVQLIQGRDFHRQAEDQWSVQDLLPARPGDIVDRSGRVLATTVRTRSLFVVPAQIRDGWQVAGKLAGAVGLDQDQIHQQLIAHPEKQFLWIKRRLSVKQIERVRVLDLPPHLWGFRDEFLRLYPQGRLAAQVLGTRDIDGHGRGGLEQSLDALLRGQDGCRVVIRDARGRVIAVSGQASRQPVHGQTIRLTLDMVIQLYAEHALDEVMDQWQPKSACAIVLDPKTGGVLAMASQPTFDPNQLENVPDKAWKNHAIAAIFEPGSTFKPLIVARAVQATLVAPQELIHCGHGQYRMGNRVLHDHHPYGKLSVVDILVKSSNIGMAKIGQRMTNRRLYEAAVCFGFGRRTGIELPGELDGIVRSLKKWNGYSTGSVPMGQEIAVTPLQLIAAYGGLANGGKLLTPHLVDYTHCPIGSVPSIVASHPIKKEVADWIIRGPLVDVVSRGTGKRARLSDYQVFGKTGTAQKPDPQTGAYSSSLHVSSFICGAPADNPRVLVLVVVDEPSVGTTHYGGTVAAPAAVEILRRSLLHLRVPGVELARRAAGQPGVVQ